MSENALFRRGAGRQDCWSDRRAAVRYHCDLEISCSGFPESDDIWLVRVQNISSAGMNLLVDRKVEPEALLAVRMQGEDPIPSYTVSGPGRARSAGE